MRHMMSHALLNRVCFAAATTTASTTAKCSADVLLAQRSARVFSLAGFSTHPASSEALSSQLGTPRTAQPLFQGGRRAFSQQHRLCRAQDNHHKHQHQHLQQHQPHLQQRQNSSSSYSPSHSNDKNTAQINKTSKADAKAKNLHQKTVENEEKEITETFARKKQHRRPWHRAGSGAEPPSASSDPTNGDQTRGRLLTTPTRLLKLILPLPYHATKAERTQFDNEKSDEANEQEEAEEIQPLALLVHPQQPLSYLERLLQAEVPPIQDDGKAERIPSITFHAEADMGGHKGNRPDHERRKDYLPSNQKKPKTVSESNGNVASYSGLGHEGPARSDAEANWVRWSSSTEIGDFIRDAARGREFALEIEGYPRAIRVAVPSFNDRTYYMRDRLRRMSRQIEQQSEIKRECDNLAHQGVHRIAQGGFAALIGWWGIVYYVTFHTDFGWDLVEPVTYLVGLTTIIGGYMWFLYISRDLSYKAALNVTVSRRQQALYQARGFDHERWDGLVQEANSLRREIKMVASEYDVDWDETRDLGSKDVKEVLEEEREKSGKKHDDPEEEEVELKDKDRRSGKGAGNGGNKGSDADEKGAAQAQ